MQATLPGRKRGHNPRKHRDRCKDLDALAGLHELLKRTGGDGGLLGPCRAQGFSERVGKLACAGEAL